MFRNISLYSAEACPKHQGSGGAERSRQMVAVGKLLVSDCLIWLSVWEDFCTVVVTESLETKWLAFIWSGNWIVPRGLFPLQDVNPSVAETQLFEGEHWLKDISYLALRTYEVQFPKHLWMSSLGGEFRLEDGINMIHQRIPEIGLVYSTQSTPSTRFWFFFQRGLCVPSRRFSLL